jgi:transglutaminase-like putative cysteine protease
MKTKNLKNKYTWTADTRWWDPLTAFVLIAALITSATRLAATQWTKDLGLTQTVVFLAGISGLAIGQSRFNRFWSALFAIAYGSFVVPWQLGLTMGEVAEWSERLSSIAGRLQIIVVQILTRQPVIDNMFFLFLMSLLYWILGVTAGYWLTRYGESWKVILPTGIATFIIDSFDPLLTRRAWYLAVYIFLALLILARGTFLRMRTEWQTNSVHFPQDIGYDLSRFAVVISLVIVLLSWNMPSIAKSFPAVTDFYRAIRAPYLNAKERASFLFAGLRASVGMVSDYYGDQQGLGTGNPKSDSILMDVQVPINMVNAPRYYWRARVYDQYSRGIWSTTATARRRYTPVEDDFPIIDAENRTEGEFTFRLYTPIISLYAAPQPLWFSRQGVIQYVSNPDLTFDLVGAKADPFIHPGEEYKVRARMTTVTVKQLRQAGNEYPDWVTGRYLQLPQEITPRTRELARQIAEPYDNPYDKTQAITKWLRDNIEYVETISPPPGGREPIDWFLFDYKKGFCNYYASAEIIMLRSLGIPARWAIGYAQGQSRVLPAAANAPAGQNILIYTVREKDAHAWPEVFFPGVGWVEFEPTVSQLPLVRPLGGDSADQANQDEESKRDLRSTPSPNDLENLPPDSGTNNKNQGVLSGVIVSGLIAVGAIILGVFTIIARRNKVSALSFWVRIIGGDEKLLTRWQTERITPREKILQSLALLGRRVETGLGWIGIQPPDALRNWTQVTLMPSISRAYMEINWALQRIGKPPEIYATPTERANKVNEFIPEAKISTDKLLVEYQKANYSTQKPDLTVARQAAGVVRKLSYRTKLRNLLNRFQERP